MPIAPYYPSRLGRLLSRWLLVPACCFLCQCVQTYVSPYKSPPTGYLVVEGFISSNSPTKYTISRTIALPGDSTIPLETGAHVTVEGSDSSSYPLPEVSAGVYGDTTLPLNPALQYRLRVNTAEGGSYASDFVPVKPSPPIDSVGWKYDATTGVTIYVNTHDPANSTHYYIWNYEETWVYYMPWNSYFEWDNDTKTVVERSLNNLVNRCWKDDKSTTVLIDNTSKLAQDDVYQFPLLTIPANTQQLSSLYTVIVTQYALTKDYYDFVTQLQANTESLGSVFDVQPTALKSNIHCLSNPAEQVIGYVAAGSIQQKRIWIRYQDLPYWEYYIACQLPNRLVPNIPDSLAYYFQAGGYTPIDSSASGYTANENYCIDCTLLGGTNVKPSFWPN